MMCVSRCVCPQCVHSVVPVSGVRCPVCSSVQGRYSYTESECLSLSYRRVLFQGRLRRTRRTKVVLELGNSLVAGPRRRLRALRLRRTCPKGVHLKEEESMYKPILVMISVRRAST